MASSEKTHRYELRQRYVSCSKSKNKVSPSKIPLSSYSSIYKGSKTCTFFVFTLPPMKLTVQFPIRLMTAIVQYNDLIMYITPHERDCLNRYLMVFNITNGCFYQDGHIKEVYYFHFSSSSIRLSDTKSFDVEDYFDIMHIRLPRFEYVKDSNVRSKLYEAYSYPLTRSKESHQETKRQQTLLLLERLERQAVGEEINASDIKESIGKIKESLAISEECSFEQEMIVLKSEDTFQKEIMDIIKMIQPAAVQNKQYQLNCSFAPFHGIVDILVECVVVLLQNPNACSPDDSDDDEKNYAVVTEIKSPSNDHTPVPQALFGAFTYMVKRFIRRGCPTYSCSYALGVGLAVTLYKLEMDFSKKKTLKVTRLSKATTLEEIQKLFYFVFSILAIL